MPEFTVTQDVNGKVKKISFKPSFISGNCQYGREGKVLMAFGGFDLDGWQWDTESQEIFKTSGHVDGITQDAKTMVRDVDETINRLLKRYLDWARFYDVHSHRNENVG